MTAGAFGGKMGRYWNAFFTCKTYHTYGLFYVPTNVSQAKGRMRFEQTGSVKDVDKFFIALVYTGICSQPTASDISQIYKQTVHLHLICDEKNLDLLIQGKKTSKIRDKLRQVLVESVT